MIKKSLLSAIILSSSFSAFSDVTIKELSVSEQLIPYGFEQEFQNNLDFFLDGVGVDQKAKVPYDTIFVRDGIVDPQYYVNTTEIGFYLNILVEAHKDGSNHALKRIIETLDVLLETPTWNGLYFWPYDIVGGKLQPTEEGIVPAVDNANLAFSLAGVAGAYLDSKNNREKEVVKKVEEIIARQVEGWYKIYDPERGLLYAGWSAKDNAPLGYYVDRKANESRLAPVWAHLVTKGSEKEVPKTAFSDMELYTGNYTIDERNYYPMLTWDGAYFQGMLPSILLNERKLIPDYSIIEDMTKMQKMHSEDNNIPFVSSAATTDDGYAAFGINKISEAYVRFGHESPGEKTGTPHATALSYMVNPWDAVNLLKTIKEQHPEIESPYGWYDSVDTEGKISTKILSLDQGMMIGSFLSPSINEKVDNYLKHKGYYEHVVEMYQSFTPDSE
ncbi:hypothetical protein [Photobacterium rosenbergii]|uniref:hypothetical protein n=1 Tax=Photobacterium rosenbergii TaxID=294936 RepID=UPI001C990400|nr:hypothetical protein [Photobacterium rosenbergii]MBY5944495.1 hypothetical protein [Photobacterium rosenbergii]